MTDNKEYKDGKWLVVELVPDFIGVHSGIQFGVPTVVGSRIHTEVAAGAFANEEWDCYGEGLNREKSFAAYCFEAGREYQRNRKLRKRISEAVHEGWEKHHQEEAEKEIKSHIGEGI